MGRSQPWVRSWLIIVMHWSRRSSDVMAGPSSSPTHDADAWLHAPAAHPHRGPARHEDAGGQVNDPRVGFGHGLPQAAAFRLRLRPELLALAAIRRRRACCCKESRSIGAPFLWLTTPERRGHPVLTGPRRGLIGSGA